MDPLPLPPPRPNLKSDPSWADVGHLLLDNIKRNARNEISLLSNELDKTSIQLIKKSTLYFFIGMAITSGLLLLITGLLIKLAETAQTPLWLILVTAGVIVSILGTTILWLRYQRLRRKLTTLNPN